MTMESRGRQKERGRSLGNHKNYRKGRFKSILGKIEFSNGGKRGHQKKYYRYPKKKGDRSSRRLLRKLL